MDADKFVNAIYSEVYQSAVDEVKTVLASPPGRAPRAALVELSAWYNALDEGSAVQARELIRLAADHAVFGFMATLDGVRTIDNTHPVLALSADGVVFSTCGDLHDVFRALVDENLGRKG